MRVLDLAQEFHTTSEVILTKLKKLHLKAKDSGQELNEAVVAVLKSELAKDHLSLEEAGKESPREATELISVSSIDSETDAPKVEKPAPPQRSGVKVKAKEKIDTKPKPEAKAKTIFVPFQPRPKVSDAPFVAVKPLPKKRRKLAPAKETAPSAPPKESLKPIEEIQTIKEAAPKPSVVTPREVKPTIEGGPQPTLVEAPLEELRELEINLPISVKDLSVRLQQKPSLVLKHLMQMGILAHINQNLNRDVVEKLGEVFQFKLVELKSQEERLLEDHKQEEEKPELLKPRAPVVTLMGHVDHGKTSLLDRIRKSRIVDAEHGGITQHIGAYSVELPKGRITFLDTPGHEAFTAMRARGALITDIVVLVIAADEGMMQQTEEALDHARAAGVPIVVALNKIDRQNSDIDRVKKQLMEKELTPEDWGGKTVVVGVSAQTGEGIDQLLEMILLEAELLELKANYVKNASGIVIEAHLSRGRGAVASLIIQSGTLREGEIVVTGPYYGRIKALFDDRERPILEAGPSKPVEVLGLNGVPEAGEHFYVVPDEKQARDICLRRLEQLKSERMRLTAKVSLEDLYNQIQKGTIKELNVIFKADVQGSLEALKHSLESIPSEEVKIRFIHMGVGDINASDVILAVASQAIIIGFQVDIEARAKDELEKQTVDVRLYRLVYDVVNDLKKALSGLLEPKTKRRFLARLEIRQVFKVSKSGTIAGCFVQKGKIPRQAQIDILRNGEGIYSGKISSLKRFKDDVRDVNEGFECGIGIDGFEDFQPGDIIEAFTLEKIERTL